MKVLFSYNFDASDIADGDFTRLYSQRRRDSTFALAYESPDGIFAFRDHLGIIPLYYRRTGNTLRFAANLSDLIDAKDTVDAEGLLIYLKFGTTRLAPLIKEIGMIPPGTVVKFTSSESEPEVVHSYVLQPRRFGVLTRFSSLVDELDRLFMQAIQRTLRHDTVGLYLSGGIDSALIGIYLRKAGANVNAYTSGPWGRTSSEIPYAGTNAQRIPAQSHSVDCLESAQYAALLESIPQLFGAPHGTSTALGVASLWQNTSLASEEQIYFGQNSDTVMGCVAAQYLSYFLQPLPVFLRKRLHPALHHRNLTANYFSFAASYEGDIAKFRVMAPPPSHSALQKVIHWGMYVVHTPADSEVLALPAVQRHIQVANPYCDVDLIEFALGIPLRHRITVTRESKIGLGIEKRVTQALALRYLPTNLVYRKKAFTVSFDRDEYTRRLLTMLPHEMKGIPLRGTEERFAAQVLSQWMAAVGLAQE